MQLYYFNPRSHEGSDYSSEWYFCKPTNFNPRSHEGSDFYSTLANGNTPTFQSALPRGERLLGMVNIQSLFVISIRAPTRGATQHDPSVYQQRKNFNPRSHEGSDHCPQPYFALPVISIRAPTRGATRETICSRIIFVFQSALPRGERHKCHSAALVSFGFQSALPRGERRERDHLLPDYFRISIRAPTRGATDNKEIRCVEFSISIRAPTRGATATTAHIPPPFTISIRAPTRGATYISCYSYLNK